MKVIQANGRINREGKLKVDFNDLPVFLEQISRNSGKCCTVKVIIDGKKRSLEQNSYYWGVVVKMVQIALLDTWGEILTSEEVHSHLKEWCNWKEIVNEQTGESIKFGKSTSDLSTTEFEEYLDRVRQFAASFLGMTIPLPNEQLEIDI